MQKKHRRQKQNKKVQFILTLKMSMTEYQIPRNKLKNFQDPMEKQCNYLST